MKILLSLIIHDGNSNFKINKYYFLRISKILDLIIGKVKYNEDYCSINIFNFKHLQLILIAFQIKIFSNCRY